MSENLREALERISKVSVYGLNVATAEEALGAIRAIAKTALEASTDAAANVEAMERLQSAPGNEGVGARLPSTDVQVHEGYRLVPIHPTEDMMYAADKARALPETYINEVWAAMVAASPAPPSNLKGSDVLNDMLLARAPNHRWTLASLLKEAGIEKAADRLAYMKAALDAAQGTPSPQPNMSAKPLEWTESPNRTVPFNGAEVVRIWEATAITRRWATIIECTDGRFTLLCEEASARHDTLQQAKDAAQSVYTRLIMSALSPAPSPNVKGVIAAFEAAHPDHDWHVGKGKLTDGEPLYGAIIMSSIDGREICRGESDESAEAAFSIAVAASGLATMGGQP